MTSTSSSLSNKVTRSINVLNKQLSYHECMTSVASTIQKVVVCRRVHGSANTLPANAPGTTPAPPDEGLLSKHVAFPRTSHGAAVVYDAPGTAIPGRYEACIFEICGHFSRLTEERTWNTCCLLGNLTLNDCVATQYSPFCIVGLYSDVISLIWRNQTSFWGLVADKLFRHKTAPVSTIPPRIPLSVGYYQWQCYSIYY